MTTASLALNPSTSLIACLISDGLKRTALARWCRVFSACGGLVATGPAVAVPDVGSCGVIGVSLRAVGLERGPVASAFVSDSRGTSTEQCPCCAANIESQYAPVGGDASSPDASVSMTPNPTPPLGRKQARARSAPKLAD